MVKYIKVISIILNVVLVFSIIYVTMSLSESDSLYRKEIDVLESSIDGKNREITNLQTQIEKSQNLVNEYTSIISELEVKQGELEVDLDQAIEDQRKFDSRLSYDYNYGMADLTVGWLYKIISNIRDEDTNEITRKLDNFVIIKEVTVGKEYNGLIVQDVEVYRTPHNENSPEAGNLYDGERIEFSGEFTISGTISYDDVEYGAYRVFTTDLDVVPHRVHHMFESVSITIVDSLEPFEVDRANQLIRELGIDDNGVVKVTLKNLVLNYQYGKPITNTAELVSIELAD